MIPVYVAGLAIDVLSNQPVVILREKNGTRILPIWIGPSEAHAIAVKLENIKVMRPITHDLLKIIIEGLDSKVKKVIISDLRDNTFYAKIYIEKGDQLISIDARPSDSVALAMRTNTDIFVQDELVKMELDLKQFKFLSDTNANSNLSDYLSKLDPEDLGRVDPDE